ncbi:hypothetical protein [Paenibacillus sp. sgz302251]|uniref:hypothetical protein n=1 Tax=Paenibacillus sp. sgz302251 TaxID=3414493 RepID=UPI003C79C380
MTDIDKSYDKFLALKHISSALTQKELNESDTRLRLIDTMFIEVLGWDKAVIHNELNIGDLAEDNSHKTLYADYLLKSDINTYLIEAKRFGNYFKLPTTGSKRVYSGKGTVYVQNKTVIDQVKKYMMKIGTPFCVLTNGHQYIIIRRPMPAQDKDIIVFRSFDDVDANFQLFYDILNPFNNGDGIIDDIIKAPDEIRQPPTLNIKLYNLIKEKDRYPFATTNLELALNSLLNMYFDDISDEDQVRLLKQCYCDPSGIYSEFAGTLKNRILADPVSSIKQLTKKDIYGDFGNFEKQYKLDLETNPGAVYVLLGDVGAGKSTFLTHFYHYDLDEATRKKIIWIRINNLRYNGPTEKLNDWITEKVNELLFEDKSKVYDDLHLNEYDTLNKIYENEISQHIKGFAPSLQANADFVDKEISELLKELRKNIEQRISKTIQYLKSIDKHICFVFDNIDQKPFEEQKELLLISHNRALSYKSTVITAMRMESYYMIKNKPPFDAIVVNEYRIEAPSVKDLLSKRLDAFNNHPQNEVIYQKDQKTIKIPLNKFVTVIKNTIEKERNVQSFLSDMSGGNMRRLLAMFRTFIKSDRSKINELVRLVEHVSANSYVSYDDFFESVTKGNDRFYQSDTSDIKNLFVYNNDGFYSHFTSIYILEYLDKRAFNFGTKGYVEIDELLEKFSMFFTDKSKLVNVLLPLMNEFLISSNVGSRREFNGTQSVIITEVGKYYLNSLIFDWRYLQNVMIDTPIRIETHAQEIFKVYQPLIRGVANKKHYYLLIKQCISIFLDYLEEVESQDIKFLEATTGSPVPFKAFVPKLKKGFTASISTVQT